jgi:hypothetical protein
VCLFPMLVLICIFSLQNTITKSRTALSDSWESWVLQGSHSSYLWVVCRPWIFTIHLPVPLFMFLLEFQFYLLNRVFFLLRSIQHSKSSQKGQEWQNFPVLYRKHLNNSSPPFLWKIVCIGIEF